MFVGSFDVDGRYSVDESLGTGAVTLVFGARHLVLGRPAALKVLRPELAADAEHARRFLDAARSASQLNHENIVAISDVGRDPTIGVTYLVMERLSGTTVDRALDGPMPLDRALRILLQIVRALAAAHAAGVVHHNLSPRNVFLVQTSGRDDHVKVADFGLSPASLQAKEAPRDHRVDVYGFGLTAFEILAGRPPHRATPPESRAGSNGEHTAEPRPLAPRPELPEDLEELISRCLAFDPSDRPASALEIEAVLMRLIDHGVTPSAPSSMVGQMIGTHRVTNLIGTGGIGTVYQAEHPLIGTQVAIKVLRPEIAVDPTMVERFVLEARASSMIGSPHIPRFLDFGYLSNGQPFAVMEYLAGETLGMRLARDGRLSLGEVVAIVTQVTSAMALAHARGIVHRDLKPDNLFLSRDEGGGQLVKVLDFGIAKLLTGDVTTRTQTGLVFGTLCYCAPEQALGASVGPAADVYALGATTFEMLTGQPPFKAAPSCLAEKTTKPAPSVHKLRPDLPDAVARDLDAMLARNPAARPTMAQVFAALEGWTRGPENSTNAVDVPPNDGIDELGALTDDAFDEPAPEPSPWRWVWFVGGAALIVVVLIAFVVSNGGDSGQSSDSKPVDRQTPTEPRTAPAPAAKPSAVKPLTADKPAPSPEPAIANDKPAPVAPNAVADKPAPVTPNAVADKPAPVTPNAVADKPAPVTTDKPAVDTTKPAAAADKPAAKPDDKARKPDDKSRPDDKKSKRSAKPRPDDGVIVDPFKD